MQSAARALLPVTSLYPKEGRKESVLSLSRCHCLQGPARLEVSAAAEEQGWNLENNIHDLFTCTRTVWQSNLCYALHSQT